MHWNCAILENAQKHIKNILKIVHFLILRHSSPFLVLDYEEVVFRCFISNSFDMQTESVLSTVWQLAAFKDKLSKYCPSKLV